jgi:hypothetical protein
MASLNWIGKEAVVNHDKEVPFKLLEKVPSVSVGKESKNLIIHGDKGLLFRLCAYLGRKLGSKNCG